MANLNRARGGEVGFGRICRSSWARVATPPGPTLSWDISIRLANEIHTRLRPATRGRRISRALRAKSRHRAENLKLESMMIYIYIFRFFVKIDMWNCKKMIQNRIQNGPKSFKIEVWGSLGALWDPSWRPSGAGATTRAQKIQKCKIFGSPRESKMDQKSIQNHIQNCMFFLHRFRNDFFSILRRFWSQKPLQNWVSEGGFSNLLLICWKCDFERQYNDFATFFTFGGMDFRS